MCLGCVGVVCAAVVSREEEQVVALTHLSVEGVKESGEVAVESHKHFLVLLTRREPCAGAVADGVR